jgi:hypothetical protein
MPAWDRAIPASRRTSGIALDPVTGRVFVSFLDDGTVVALGVEPPTRSAPPASVAEALPGPLEISLAPQDVARTIGLSLFVLLLVGAPTPLFNETLEANLGAIQAGLGRLIRRRRGSSPGPGHLAAALRRFSGSLPGIGFYVVVAAVIYSFLTPGFPDENGLLVLGVALLGIAVATAADSLPGDVYVARRYHAHGRVRVAVWTLAVAAVCVLISRLADMQPGYMYGIIGTLVFGVALSTADEGRMEAWGALALLVLAIGAWFARVPFEPEPGVPASGASLVINSGLVGIFVVAVEGLVFGLVPLSFLPGRKILAWSRWRWLLLWGAGLVLFAHVLVYPVTVAQPNPDPASLATTLVSVGIYGSLAVAFWGFFRWRARRRGADGLEGDGRAGR